MVDIRGIVDLYDLYKSYRRVARELKISRNTVTKYVLKVRDVQVGLTDEILSKNREIVQTSLVLSQSVRQKIHELLELNLIDIIYLMISNHFLIETEEGSWNLSLLSLCVQESIVIYFYNRYQ